jgi:hypothetical protein
MLCDASHPLELVASLGSMLDLFWVIVSSQTGAGGMLLMLWYAQICAYPVVQCITISLISSLGMQIDPHISSQHTAKAFLVCRQYGQTGNTMVIAHCHQILWLKCSSPSQILRTNLVHVLYLNPNTS